MAFHASKNHVAVLDIGTTKVVCFIAVRDEATNHFRIEGIGHQLSEGARAGVITDVAAAERSINHAVHAAEKMAGFRIEHVVINVSGGQLSSRTVRSQHQLSGHPVSRRDISSLIQKARAEFQQNERTIIYCSPISYQLDEAHNIKDPTGMYGNHLGADVHVVTLPISTVKNLTNCVARAQLDVDGFLIASHCSGLACLSKDEMELGITLLDIGGGTTSVAVFSEGQPIFTDAIAIGGNHVTQDLAHGLSTSLDHAERIKALHGHIYAAPADNETLIEIPRDDTHAIEMKRSVLSGIIRPRMEELMELVRSRLDEAGLSNAAGRRLVITGGGSQLMGTEELAARMLRKQVRIANPKPIEGMAEAISTAPFSASIGMLRYLDLQKHHVGAQMHGQEHGLARASRMLKEWGRQLLQS